MNKRQAEAAADVLFLSQRRRDLNRAGPSIRSFRTSKERWLLAAFTIAGALVGIAVFYFAGRHANSLIMLFGAELGAGAGALAGWLALLVRRVLTIHSSRRAARGVKFKR